MQPSVCKTAAVQDVGVCSLKDFKQKLKGRWVNQNEEHDLICVHLEKLFGLCVFGKTSVSFICSCSSEKRPARTQKKEQTPHKTTLF